MRWFWQKKPTPPAEPPPPPVPAPKKSLFFLNVIDHPNLCVWRPRTNNAVIARVIVSPQVEEWLAANMTGAYLTGPSGSANFVAFVEIEKETDAVLFKMFWL